MHKHSILVMLMITTHTLTHIQSEMESTVHMSHAHNQNH